eukprot:scaffold47815_cov20-Tisochrysis_lutea.AAC.3
MQLKPGYRMQLKSGYRMHAYSLDRQTAVCCLLSYTTPMLGGLVHSMCTRHVFQISLPPQSGNATYVLNWPALHDWQYPCIRRAPRALRQICARHISGTLECIAH